MLSLLLSWFLSAVVLLLVSKVLPGVYIDTLLTALLAALVIGLINTFIKPILSLLTLPINWITLGLFAFVLNALMFWLAASIVPGFEVSNFWSALLGSLVLAVITSLLTNLQMPRSVSH